MDRDLQTKDANDRIDQSIATFLSLLSRHFLKEAAAKILEFLIRQYRCNGMAVIFCTAAITLESSSINP